MQIWIAFFESLKIVLINMVAFLMMSRKLANLGLLKIKAYDVILSAHDVTNEILSHDSNYIVDVVIK